VKHLNTTIQEWSLPVRKECSLGVLRVIDVIH